MTMNKTFTAVILTAAFCLPAAHAEQDPAPAKPDTSSTASGHQMGAMGNMGGGMGAMMMSDDRLKQKQEHLLKMHELSDKIIAATDPKEKDRLKAEQLRLMKEHEKQHLMMMQQHMQEMMKNKGGMGNMKHGGEAGGMGGMQHGNAAPPAPAQAKPPAMQH